jgi:hypothetical protein
VQAAVASGSVSTVHRDGHRRRYAVLVLLQVQACAQSVVVLLQQLVRGEHASVRQSVVPNGRHTLGLHAMAQVRSLRRRAYAAFRVQEPVRCYECLCLCCSML